MVMSNCRKPCYILVNKCNKTFKKTVNEEYLYAKSSVDNEKCKKETLKVAFN